MLLSRAQGVETADALLPRHNQMSDACGWLVPAQNDAPDFGPAGVCSALDRPHDPVWLIEAAGGDRKRPGLAFSGRITCTPDTGAYPIRAMLPPIHAEWLGDRTFCEEHGTRFPYVTGAMATGIASVDLVCAASRAGFLAFYGTGGLEIEQVERGIEAIARRLADTPGAAWGANLIHSPDRPGLEDALVDLYLARGVGRVEASAFMALSPAVVRFATAGLRGDAQGRIHRPHRVMAKISRPEVARHFLQPPPADLLAELVRRGAITLDESRLAALLPVADDVTCEADSGGHTDRRPLSALLPLIRRQRDALSPPAGWPRPLRIGAAGGLGDPAAVAAAFALGADYVVTGSVNQLACESGTSDLARAMLAEAGLADVTMAPAADMFELGVEVQVLRRGTLFAPRARRLFELYRACDGIEALPRDVRARIEREIFRADLDDIWRQCESFWSARQPAELDRAARDPRHRMALVFRWYLGQSTRWAREGVADRQQDFQIWCGPAIGAVNAWTAGSALADPARRTVAGIGLNLLAGAVRVTRAQQLRAAGVAIPDLALRHSPASLEAFA